MREPFKIKDRTGEKGSAVVALVLVAFVILLIATASMKSSFLRLKAISSAKTRYSESVKAESGANILEAVIKKRLIEVFTEESRAAKNCLMPAENLPVFDDSAATDPKPRYSNGACQTGGAATSLLGNINQYLAAKNQGFETEAAGIAQTGEIKVKVAQMQESARIYGAAGEPSYIVGYILDASGGAMGRARRQGRAMFAVNQSNCAVYAVMSAANNSIMSGAQATLKISYSYAARLRIYDAASSLLYDQPVAENSAAQTFDYNFSPGATDSYRVEAIGAEGTSCRSVSATTQIVVTKPADLCPTVNNFSSSSANVFDGEQVAISWNLSSGTDYRLNGVPIAASGTQNFVVSGASRTFTLTATNLSNSCPVSRQITVTSSPRPPCAPTPAVDDFQAIPPSIQIGGTTRLQWSVSNLVGGAVQITGSNGSSYTVGAGGALDISGFASAGTVTYTIYATNSCGGNNYTAQRQTTVTITNCPQPSISDFTVNPSSVTVGGNQTVQFNWNASSSCAANVSIDNGVGNSLPVSGSISISQPQTTTDYTLTISNASGSAQRQVTINADNPPSGIGDYFYSETRSHWFQAPPLGCNENFEWVYNANVGIVRLSPGQYQVQNNLQTSYFANPYGCSSPNASVEPVIKQSRARFAPAQGSIVFYDAGSNQVASYSYVFSTIRNDSMSITAFGETAINSIPANAAYFQIVSPTDITGYGLDTTITDPQQCTRLGCPDAPSTYGDVIFVGSPVVSMNEFPR